MPRPACQSRWSGPLGRWRNTWRRLHRQPRASARHSHVGGAVQRVLAVGEPELTEACAVQHGAPAADDAELDADGALDLQFEAAAEDAEPDRLLASVLGRGHGPGLDPLVAAHDRRRRVGRVGVGDRQRPLVDPAQDGAFHALQREGTATVLDGERPVGLGVVAERPARRADRRRHGKRGEDDQQADKQNARSHLRSIAAPGVRPISGM